VSQVASFVIADQNMPILIPFDPNITLELRPEFRWHSVSGATTYNVDIDSSIDFSTMILTVPVTDTFYTPLVDLPTTTIYWRVKSDLSPQYSDIGTLIIQPSTIPFLYRFNGDTVQDFRPEFRWKPVSGATIYQIEIDTTSDLAAPFISMPLNDTLYEPSIDLIDMKLYWHVSSNVAPDVFCLVDSVVTSTITEINLTPGSNVYTKNVITYCQKSSHKVKVIYKTKKSTEVTLCIYSVTGRMIKRISQTVSEDNNIIIWDGKDRYFKLVSAGTYIFRIHAEGKNYYQKVNLLF
jgi:hypothetical protein